MLPNAPERSGEHILYGQRINGHVRLTDVPATGRGRAYLVEGELDDAGRPNAARQKQQAMRRSGHD